MSLALALLLLQGPVALPSPADTDLWVLEHDGIQARLEGDAVVEVIRRPRLIRGDVELEASMAVFWLDRAALASRRVALDLGDGGDGTELPRDLFEGLADDPASRILREVYFEGPVIYRQAGEKLGSAQAFYLDLDTERGWIADAELIIDRDVDGRAVNWRARAEWLERQPDGTLRSNQAVVTSCAFVERHLFVQTEDLTVARLDPDEEAAQSPPRDDGGDEDEVALGAYEISLRGNSLRAYDLVGLPLPPLSWRADRKGRPILPEIKIGSSARFGSFVETALAFDVSGVGDGVHGLFGADTSDEEVRQQLRSDGRVGVSVLGSRGVLLDLGMRLERDDHYRWDVALGGLVDDDRDRGLLRVDQGERSDLRTWLRSRGRWSTGEGSWLDLAVSTQSDAGVQAEFYEDEFLRYEQRENYVHWRTAGEGTFLSARIKARVDQERSTIEELPRLAALVDRRPVAELFGTPLLYSADGSAAWLRRAEGDPGLASPFGPAVPFGDGLGNEEVLRADTTHRLEAPVTFAGGWRLAPYLELRGTAWDRDEVDQDDPTRLDLAAGARLSTLFWTRRAGGTTIQLGPFVDLRESVVHETSGGAPLLIDAVELPTDHDELAVGLRAHVFGWREDDELDVEAKALRTDAGGADDWDELEVFAGLRTELFDRPLGLSHDGRYGLDGQGSLVTRTGAGYRPTDTLGLELSHARALDEVGAVHYEALTLQALYRWTPKWELQGRQTVSVLDDASLGHEVLLRRYGHDLVFEVGVSRVSGEGGTTITLRLRPEVLFRTPSIGDIGHR